MLCCAVQTLEVKGVVAVRATMMRANHSVRESAGRRNSAGRRPRQFVRLDFIANGGNGGAGQQVHKLKPWLVGEAPLGCKVDEWFGKTRARNPSPTHGDFAP